MTNFVRHASIVSTIALLTVGTAGLASAQNRTYGDQNNDCVEGQDNCPPREMRKSDDGDQATSKKRRIQQNEDETTVNEPDQPRKVREAKPDWRFDSKQHERRRERDKRFRFESGGYWYPEPYWSIGIGPSRIGCSEGRAIVRERGFYRVSTIECQGRTYTYLGRRHGDTFRVLLSSRSGRIVNILPD